MAKVMKLKIFMAADAFLYLPTHIAKQLGIFETVLDSLVNSVEYQNSDGDLEAIKNMLTENAKNDTLAIAVADPTVFLSPRFKNSEKCDIRVIGAIIDKLPFWAVGRPNDVVLESIQDFSKFESVIHCGGKYSTGDYLGNLIKNVAGIAKGKDDVEFGQEILELETADHAVAVTADIVSVVRAEKGGYNINYKFSQKEEGKNHITTGILTTKKCCEKEKDMLSKIVESIQKAISILYCSSKTAESICSQLEEAIKKGVKPLEIKRIIQLIQEEQFYPMDLNITKEEWNNGVKALSLAQQWDSEYTNNLLINSYMIYVVDEFVLKSEKSIANQFGIDLKTFKDETDELLKNAFKAKCCVTVKWLCCTIHLLNRQFGSFFNLIRHNSLNAVVIVISVLILTTNYYYKFINFIDQGTLALVGLLINVITFIVSRKKAK
jgi:hypothetical protein